MSEPSNSPPGKQESTICYRLQHPCSILAITDLNRRGAVGRQTIPRTEIAKLSEGFGHGEVFSRGDDTIKIAYNKLNYF